MWSDGKDAIANRHVDVLWHSRSRAKNDNHTGGAVQLDAGNRVGEFVNLVGRDLAIGHQEPERALA